MLVNELSSNKELDIEEIREVDGETVLKGIAITNTFRSVASGLWEISKWLKII